MPTECSDEIFPETNTDICILFLERAFVYYCIIIEKNLKISSEK